MVQHPPAELGLLDAAAFMAIGARGGVRRGKGDDRLPGLLEGDAGAVGQADKACLDLAAVVLGGQDGDPDQFHPGAVAILDPET